MSKNPKSPDQPDTLAKEELSHTTSDSAPTHSPESLLHELQVHQVELEMQNEELHRTQIALEEAHERYLDLYEFAPVGYLTLSRDTLITSINLTGAGLLGTDRQKLIGRRFSGFVAPEDHARWQHYLMRAMSSPDRQACELTLRHANGTRLNFQLNSFATSTDASKQELRIALTDITERKRLEHVLLDNNSELTRARAVADKANHAKSDFLSSMSHELRSPLNAILGFAQLLETGTPAPTQSQKTRINQIIQAGWYLLGLINEILDLAMIESGKQPMTLESLSLSEVLLDCQSMLEAQAGKSNIHINFPKFDSPCFVYADRTRLKQILINLLSNAIKYNRVDGTVDVTFHTNMSAQVHIGVQDTGEGIPSERLRELFQPFNRLGQQAGTEEGFGIGLVICKRLVELMGGRIGVESVVGTGSVFWIELHTTDRAPDAMNSTELLEPVQSAVQSAVQSGAPLRTVLYVEDNPTNMMLVEQILERRSGIRLFKAGNGTSGIAMARINLPEVILMDINLPGISGVQALKILRTDPLTAHIPVLAISANAMPLDVQRGLEAGFFKYITKPLKVNEFLEALEEALEYAKNTPRHTGSTENPHAD